MTTYGAYDAGLPCKNSACKSHGKPHPNCRCYGDMAEGGEVKHFCSEENHHLDGCEYQVDLFTFAPPVDPEAAVSGFLTKEGLAGLLKMDLDHDLEKYNKAVKRGSKMLEDQVESIFSGKSYPKEETEKAKEAVDKWVAAGGITSEIQNQLVDGNLGHEVQNFSHGGEATLKRDPMRAHPVADVYPDQNVLLQAFKGRAGDYLNSLRPLPNMPKLAFDYEPQQSAQEKAYKRALSAAVNPTGILRKIQKGTIEPEHVVHFNALYPEIAEQVKKKLAEKITVMQLEGERPNYKVRQGLSLFLGTALSAEMTPANIQAAQAALRSPVAEPQSAPGNAPKESSSKALAKSSQSYLLAEDAAASRQQKQ